MFPFKVVIMRLQICIYEARKRFDVNADEVLLKFLLSTCVVEALNMTNSYNLVNQFMQYNWQSDFRISYIFAGIGVGGLDALKDSHS